MGCKQICKDYEDTIRPIRYDIGCKRCDSCRTVIVHTFTKKYCPCCHKLLKTRPKNFPFRTDLTRANRKKVAKNKEQIIEIQDIAEKIRYLKRRLETETMNRKREDRVKDSIKFYEKKLRKKKKIL